MIPFINDEDNVISLAFPLWFAFTDMLSTKYEPSFGAFSVRLSTEIVPSISSIVFPTKLALTLNEKSESAYLSVRLSLFGEKFFTFAIILKTGVLFSKLNPPSTFILQLLSSILNFPLKPPSLKLPSTDIFEYLYPLYSNEFTLPAMYDSGNLFL